MINDIKEERKTKFSIEVEFSFSFKLNKIFEINRWQIVISCVIINLISTN